MYFQQRRHAAIQANIKPASVTVKTGTVDTDRHL